MTTIEPSADRDVVGPRVSEEVRRYVERQPSLAGRRRFMRAAIQLIVMRLMLRTTVTGLENIPASGPTILMMNHISLLDPILCMGAVTPRFVVAMTKVENMRNPILGPLIRWWGAFSVNRGEVDRMALANSIELVRSGTLLLIAPEGTRQRTGLAQPKQGLAYVATKADAVIVPAAISGAVGWLDDLKRLRRPNVRVDFGRPFRFKVNGRTRIPRDELNQMMEEAMYQLAATVSDTSMRGVYSDLSKATTEHIEFI